MALYMVGTMARRGLVQSQRASGFCQSIRFAAKQFVRRHAGHRQLQFTRTWSLARFQRYVPQISSVFGGRRILTASVFVRVFRSFRVANNKRTTAMTKNNRGISFVECLGFATRIHRGRG